jgi:hypothetical protein
MNNKKISPVPLSGFSANAFGVPLRPAPIRRERVQIDLGWKNFRLEEGEISWDGSACEQEGLGVKVWSDRESPLRQRWLQERASASKSDHQIWPDSPRSGSGTH